MLTEKPLNPEYTDARRIIADLKTYVATTAHRRRRAGHFWFVTVTRPPRRCRSLWRGNAPRWRRQSLVPDGVEHGGSPRLCRGTSFYCHRRCHHTHPDPALLTCDSILPSLLRMRGQQWAAREYYTTLDALGRTLYPLFCVSVHEHVWMAAGYGVWKWRGI